MFNDWNARGASVQVMPSNLNGQCNWFLPQQIHPGGMNVLLGDGGAKREFKSQSQHPGDGAHPIGRWGATGDW